MVIDKHSFDPLTRELYRLIRVGELLPGERIDQRTMAERLNVSRTPLREALRALAMDGVLVHLRNQGYHVVKLSSADLLELYSIRAFLEGKLIESLEWPDEEQLGQLREANARYVAALREADLGEIQEAGKNFYFTIYAWSPFKVFMDEANRIWRISEPYRTIMLANSEHRRKVQALHDEVVAALEDRDRDELLRQFEMRRSLTLSDLKNSLRSPLSEAHQKLPQSFFALKVVD